MRIGGNSLILLIKRPFLKKVLKISGYILLSLLTILVILAMLIQTEWAQNYLVSEATSRFSKAIGTKVQVKRVSISLLNRVYMEGTLIEDKNKDTLLYAGALKVSITDWFFLKNQAELHYLGLNDAIINLKRTDSVWNHQFIADFFAGPSKPTKKEGGIEFSIKRMELKNVDFRQIDQWVGENREFKVGYLNLVADEINFARKKIFIRKIDLEDPLFTLYNYEGRRPPRTGKKTPAAKVKGELQWNVVDWDILVYDLEMKDGRFRNDIFTERPAYAYFDGSHIDFTDINLKAKNISWQKDTISAYLDLSTKERSGFQVDKLLADFKLYPEAMIFSNLDIKTPTSHLSNYYSMRFDDFNSDMGDFLHSVRLEGRFRDSYISSTDIAYFAPDLKEMKTSLKIKGVVTGTIDNLTANGFNLQYGRNTFLDGDIKMKGLPDIDNTLINFESNDFRTTYADVVTIVPSISKITEPDLKELQFLNFRGNFTGYIRDFVTKGTIETALGTVKADVNLKLPSEGQPVYTGLVETNGFNLGKFLGNTELGVIAFNGKLKGKGFNPKSADAEINGKITAIEWNKYVFQNVDLTGKLQNREFIGSGTIDDPNFKAALNGSFNLNSEQPEYNLMVDVQRSNLKTINLTEADLSVIGKFRLNFKGKTVDDFIGEASLYDVALTRGEETYVFDTLYLYSMKIEDNKQIEITNSDFHISLFGVYTIRELPHTLTAYLSKYYPMYFKAPAGELKAQDFSFSADLKNIDQYLPLLDSKLKGLDYSKINGKINTAEKTLSINVDIPYLAYQKYELNDFHLEGNGDLDSLRIFSKAGTITVNDSLEFPETSLSILSAGNVSQVNFRTSANQTINAADMSAAITNLPDGVKIHFNPSTVVLNDKTWRIEKNGELTISRSLLDANNISITNGEQEILISSLPSSVGNSNDLALSLRRVNMGDILPFFMKVPKIEGITSGDITVEDPYGDLKIYLNAQTDQTRFEGDSIGITTLNGFWDNKKKRSSFFLVSDNQDYRFDVKGGLNLEDTLNQSIEASIDITELKLGLLETYLTDIFSDIRGKATGKLRISGNLKKPDFTGSVKISGGGLKVDYTQCFYTLNDPTITFQPGVIDFGEITITDVLGNTGLVKGKLTHGFFNDFGYDFDATSSKLLLMNTTRLENKDFFGTAVGSVKFSFKGPSENMKMYVEGTPVDSSTFSINTSGNSKQKGDVDFIVWRLYGREMNLDSLSNPENILSIDLNLTANPLIKVNVILDELSGDVISARGFGNLRLHTSTIEALTLTGKFTVDRGNYNFNFQDIFKKPFVLQRDPVSTITWTGDPYNAELNVYATYLAEKVRMSTLFTSPTSSTVSGVSSDVLNELSDVEVICHITGTLASPQPSFLIQLPTTSEIKNNPAVDGRLKTINRDPLEVSKQATYLIVFKSFAPQNAVVASDLNSELINNTISGVINSILASSISNFFYKILGSSVDVNFNYSRILTDITGTGAAPGSSNNFRENVSLQFIKSMLDDKLTVTFGSDFNFSTANSSAVGNSQSFLFLPDVVLEYKITPDGKLRTSFFYRSTFDAMSTSGRRDRTGANISFRTEFDRFFRKKKASPAVKPKDEDDDQPKADSSAVSSANVRQ